MTDQKLTDEFRGDDAHLVRSIQALLALDAHGALVPHGVGGHGRGLLSAAAARLSRGAHAPQGESKPTPEDCQHGYGDVCAAGARDGVVCPEDSCDIDDGIRAAPSASAQQAEPVAWYRDVQVDASEDSQGLPPRYFTHRSVHAYPQRPIGEGWEPLYAAPAPSVSPADTFQARVQPWMLACFGAEIAADQQERNHRFLEEALELVQACGATASEAHQLVEYVYGRPVGEKHQEAGGVMVTLAALCLAQGLDMHEAGETELARIWTKVEQIRAKQAAKPKHSPLPQHAA